MGEVTELRAFDGGAIERESVPEAAQEALVAMRRLEHSMILARLDGRDDLLFKSRFGAVSASIGIVEQLAEGI